MNQLSTEERAQVIRCLIEGNSIRSTRRITGFGRNTIARLLVALGQACSEYQDRTLRNLTPTLFLDRLILRSGIADSPVHTVIHLRRKVRRHLDADAP